MLSPQHRVSMVGSYRVVSAFLVAAPLAACASIPPGPCALGDPWREDVNVAIAVIQRRHPQVDRVTPAARFAAAVRRTCGGLPKVTPMASKLAVAKLVAQIGDPHTILDLDSGRVVTSRYPMHFHWFADGLHIVAVDPAYHDYLGARVVSVANVPIDVVRARLTEFAAWSTEGWRTRWASALLRRPEILQVLDLAKKDGTVEFGVVLDGATATLRMAPDAGYAERRWPPGVQHILGAVEGFTWDYVRVAPERTPLFLQRSNENIWSERIADGRILYLRHNDAYDAMRSQRGLIVASRKLIENEAIDALIYDLRFNPGGDFTRAEDAVRSLLGSKVDQPHRLYVLVNSGTFSAAIYLADILRAGTPNAIFVGEPVGDRLIAYRDSDPVTLPHSQTQLYVSTEEPLYVGRRGTAIEIDIPVAYTFEDYAQGRDPILAAALAAHAAHALGEAP